MKIMFILPRLSGGGAEKVLTNLASSMAKRHDVCLVTLRDTTGYAYPVSDQVEQIRLRQEPPYKEAIENVWRFLHLNHFPRLRKAKKTWYQQYPVRLLEKYKRRYQIDASVSFLTPANYLNTMAKGKAPAIISIRSCMTGDYAPQETKEPVQRQTLVYSLDHADHVVSVSKEAAATLVDHYNVDPGSLSVIYNPCDPAKIRTKSKETPDDPSLIQKIEKASFVFLSSGRLTAKKGQWHLLHAFELVVQKHPDALLVILGKVDDTAIEALLKDTIKEKQLEDHVLLAGFHDNPYPYLSHGDAFVLSSFNEGFPNALIEALALDLPVISTDCRSGPREILAPNTPFSQKTATIDYAEYGILTPECSGNRDILREAEENEIMLAQAMIRLIEDPELRNHYSLKAAQRANDFDPKDIYGEWENLIQKLIEK